MVEKIGKKQKKFTQSDTPRNKKTEKDTLMKQSSSSHSKPMSLLKTAPPLELISSRRAGGKLCNVGVVFSRDSKHFFCAVSQSVKMYSTSTMGLVKTIHSTEGHSDTITQMILNPINNDQLITTSLDGRLLIWDIEHGTIVESVNFEYPICAITVGHNKEFLYVGCSKSKADKQKTKFLRYNITKNKISNWTTLSTAVLSIATLHEENLIAICTLKCVEVYNMETMTFQTHGFESGLTTMKLHPNQSFLAVGDKRGRIWLLYYNQRLRTKMHWHSQRVNAVSFTNDGTSMLSGGEECVLAIWQLGSAGRDFLPRLGSEVSTISVSPDHRYYALGHTDNTIRLVTTTNKIVTDVTIGLKASHNNQELYPIKCGLVQDPKTQQIVMAGTPGFIQFFDLAADEHVLDLEIKPMNRIKRTDAGEIALPYVQRVVFDKSGDWMVTIDGSEYPEFKRDVYLKFWRFNHTTQQYQLSTRIDHAHDDKVTCLRMHFSNKKLMAVTTSLDGSFKIWELSETTDGSENFWFCKSVNCYRNFVANYAAISSDGSLIAIAHQNTITLWDPHSNLLRATLVCPLEEHHFQSLEFIPNTPMMVARTPESVHIFNLVTLSSIWSIVMKTSILSIDSQSSRFILVSSNDRGDTMHIFTADCLIPLFTKPFAASILATSFIDGSALVLTSDFELTLLSDSVLEIKDIAQIVSAPPRISVISEIFGDITIKPKKQVIGNLSKIPETRLSFLDYPSHMVPASSKLYINYFDSVLTKKERIIEVENAIVESESMLSPVIDDPMEVVVEQEKAFNATVIADLFKSIEL